LIIIPVINNKYDNGEYGGEEEEEQTVHKHIRRVVQPRHPNKKQDFVDISGHQSVLTVFYFFYFNNSADYCTSLQIYRRNASVVSLTLVPGN
jgi:hypothetical protein